VFNNNDMHFNIVRRQTEMTHQHRAALGRALLNVLLANGIKAHCSRSCWRRTFWAGAV